MIQDLEWMSEEGGLPLGSLGAAAANKHRALHGLARLLQAQELARVLYGCWDIPGADKKVRQLSSQLDRLQTVEQPTQATLVELDTAARLARFLPGITLAEPPAPDVVCTIPEVGQLGFECKRPQTKKGLLRCIHDASGLASQQSFPCAIIVDVQCLLYRTDDPDRRVYFDLLTSSDDLRTHHGNTIRQLIESSASESKQAFARDVFAICFCATTWGFVQPPPGNPGAYVYSWVAEWSTNGDTWAAQLANGLHQLLQ